MSSKLFVFAFSLNLCEKIEKVTSVIYYTHLKLRRMKQFFETSDFDGFTIVVFLILELILGIPGNDDVTSALNVDFSENPPLHFLRWRSFFQCREANFGLNTKKMSSSIIVRKEEDIGDIDPTRISRSVFVTGFNAATKSEDLIIHFQRKKNGGGDIDSIVISGKKGAAVVTFDDPKGEKKSNVSSELE